MTLLPMLPIVIPLLTAAVSLFFWRQVRVQRVLAVAGSTGLLAASLALLWRVDQTGIQVVQVGSWPAPFGITFVADLLGAIMVTLGAFMGLVSVVYSLWSIDARREAFGYYPLVQFLMMGISGAFLTGDIFNLYVWFEVLLMSSFVLMALGGDRAQLEGSIKYVTLNLMSSALFLAAVGILYGVVGTLNMADLSVKLAAGVDPAVATILAMLFLVAFGIKAAIFPLFFWLPASYHTPPPVVSALFAGLLTKVGVYSLIRVFTLLFVHDIGHTHMLLLVIAGFTMVTGVLGAAAQGEFRRILAFHSVSQIGYMIMGLGLMTPLSLAAAVYYMLHHSVVKTCLFLVSGIVLRLRGTNELKRLGSLYRLRPGLSLLFLIPAMSLAGVPPLSGFFAKLGLVISGIETGSFLLVGVALTVSILTMYSMTKIWAAVFWKETPEDEAIATEPTDTLAAKGMMIPVTVLVLVTVVMGLGAEGLFGLLMRTATQLLDPSAYVAAVLGAQP